MSRTIDERIVQMTFNNKDFEKNAKQTISTLGNLKSSMNFGNNVGLINLSSITHPLNTISANFSDLEQIGIGALRRIGEAAVNLGTNLLKSLTIEPFMYSWAKYDEGIAAQQSIMSAVEGKVDAQGNIYDMDAVIKRVEKLKWYSDETSYSITQMTNAVGQFTASGQDLDVSVNAVMGIANACADAGVSTKKAESAFIGFSKAIGSGTLTLGTWNMQLKTSGITNSERFRKTLLDTASEMGTLKKVAEGTYKTLSGDTVSTANFTEFLQKGIITSDVLVQTLNKFADTTETVRSITTGDMTAITDIFANSGKEMSSEMKSFVENNKGQIVTASTSIEMLKKAYEEAGIEIPKSLNALRRAQEAISLSQALEATKDAASSQFSNIFESLFGNYEEAKKLWSSVADSLNEWIVGPLYNLVDIVDVARQKWDSLKFENENLPDTPILDIWERFVTIIESLQESFGRIKTKVFGEINEDIDPLKEAGMKLYQVIIDIQVSLYKINDFINNSSSMTDIENALSGILSILRLLKESALIFINSFIKPLKEKLKPIIEDILVIFGNLGSVINNFSGREIENGLLPLITIFETVLTILDPIIKLIKTFTEAIKNATSELANNSDKAEETGEKFSLFKAILEKIQIIVKGISDAFSNIGNIFSKIGEVISKIGKKIGEVFGTIKQYISDFLESNSGGLNNIAQTGFLGTLIILISTLSKKLKTLDLENLTINLKSGLIEKIKGVFDQLGSSLEQLSNRIKTANIASIAKSLLILAGALFVIALIPEEKLTSSLLAITSLLGEVLGAAYLLGKIDTKKSTRTVTKALTNIAKGLILMAIALKIVSSINPESLGYSLLALGAMLAGILIFVEILGKSKGLKGNNIQKTMKSISSFAFGILILSVALKVLDSMDPLGLAKSLTALGFLLLELEVFVEAISKKSSGFAIAAFGMLLLAPALLIMSGALAILSTIPGDGIANSLGALLGLLGEIGIFGALMSKVAPGFLLVSAALLIMAPALLGLVGVLALLSALKWDKVGPGLGMLASLLAVIGLEGAALGLISPLLLMFAIALTTFSGALLLMTAVMFKAMEAVALFKVLGSDFSLVIGEMIMGLTAAVVSAIPMLILGIIEAILNTVQQLINLVGTIIKIICSAIKENVPVILETVTTVALSLINSLKQLFPALIELGAAILNSLIDGVRSVFPNLIQLVFDIITTILEGFSNNLPNIIQGVYNILVSAINGLAETIRGGGLGEALGNLASAIIEGLVGGLVDMVGTFGEKIGEFGKSVFDEIKGWFTGEESEEGSNAAEESGTAMINNYGKGMEAQEPALLTKVDVIANNVADKACDEEACKESGKDTIKGIITGLENEDLLNELYAKGASLAATVNSGYRDNLDINSPSKVMAKNGFYTVLGLVKGIEDNQKMVKNAGHDLAGALKSALDISSQIMDEDLNPVITPVLDLSQIQNGAGYINSLFGNQSLALAGGVNGMAIGGQNTININFSIDNSGKDITESDINKWGDMLTDKINESLGKLI